MLYLIVLLGDFPCRFLFGCKEKEPSAYIQLPKRAHAELVRFGHACNCTMDTAEPPRHTVRCPWRMNTVGNIPFMVYIMIRRICRCCGFTWERTGMVHVPQDVLTLGAVPGPTALPTSSLPSSRMGRSHITFPTLPLTHPLDSARTCIPFSGPCPLKVICSASLSLRKQHISRLPSRARPRAAVAVGAVLWRCCASDTRFDPSTARITTS